MDHRLESLVRIPPRLLFPMVFTFLSSFAACEAQHGRYPGDARGVFVRRHPAPPLSGCRF